MSKKPVLIARGPLLNFGGGPIRLGRVVYRTSEHFFQALKARDPESHRLVKRAKTPRDAKIAGRAVPMRDDWEEVKIGLMMAVLLLKFGLNPELRQMLLDTGKRPLIEDRPDPVWGRGGDGNGHNFMGKALMAVREVYKENKEYADSL